MKRITKEMCMIYIKDHYKSNLIVLSILSVFAVIAVGFFTKNVIVAAIIAALAFVTIFYPKLIEPLQLLIVTIATVAITTFPEI